MTGLEILIISSQPRVTSSFSAKHRSLGPQSLKPLLPLPALTLSILQHIAAYSATCESLWLRNLLSELQLLSSSSTILKCDNEAAIKIATHHMVTPRSKHFDTKFHFLREQLREGHIALSFCPGSENIADFFTKPLKQAKFALFRSMIGIVPCVST
jgi:hypothetical protein